MSPRLVSVVSDTGDTADKWAFWCHSSKPSIVRFVCKISPKIILRYTQIHQGTNEYTKLRKNTSKYVWIHQNISEDLYVK